VICLLGHKEDDLAKVTAEILAARLNTHVVVTAGIHWDDLDEEGIQQVIQNSHILLEKILERIQGNASSQNKT
jgi:hypothetical protein